MKEAGRSLPMWATGFMPTPWTQQSRAAGRQPAELRRAGRQSASRTSGSCWNWCKPASPTTRCASCFIPLLDEADFDLLRQIHIRQPTFGRSPGTDHRSASPGRQQRLGRVARGAAPAAGHCWPAIRIWRSIVCRPSGTRPCCSGARGEHYVMGATLPGCPLFAVARTRISPGASPTSKGTRATSSSKIAGPAAAPAGNIAAATPGTIFAPPRKRSVRKGHPAEVFDVYFNGKGTLEADSAAGHARLLSVDCLDRHAARGRPVDRHLAGS